MKKLTKALLAAFALLAFFSLPGGKAYAEISQEEKDALANFYSATGGDNWYQNTNWNNDAVDECDWYGIVCNVASEHITTISLPSNNLSGVLPESIGNFSWLEELDLNRNNLEGAIPESIGNLTNLQTLELQLNDLDGSLPTTIGGLTSLIKLNISDNWLTGSIPLEIGNLTNLEYLNLGRNFIEGTIPAEIGNLTNLIKLLLNDNYIGGDIPSELGNLTNLTHLYLNINELTGGIPESFGNLTNIYYLYLEDNLLDGEIPSDLFSNLTNLFSFTLGLNSLTGPIPDLSNNTNLKVFDVEGNNFTSYQGTEFPLSLTYFDAEDNILDDESVNLILSQFAQNIADRPDGTIDLEGVTMGILDSEGITDMDFLENFGWTVYANVDIPDPTDEDDDGYTEEEDCDDNDPDINPGAEEVCDDIDNDCDGETDENLDCDVNPDPVDDDDDGYTDDEDCDDNDPNINPGAEEICDDDIDNDCSGTVDDGADCNNDITPIDLDPTDPTDEDGDGYSPPEDCNDNNASINPGHPEVCDNWDNNCNLELNEGLDCSSYYCDDIIISDVDVDDVDEDSAIIKFKTNMQAAGEILYSRDKDDLDDNDETFDSDTSHKVKLDDLKSDEKYYFRIEAVNGCGDKDKTKTRSFTTDEDEDKDSDDDNNNNSPSGYTYAGTTAATESETQEPTTEVERDENTYTTTTTSASAEKEEEPKPIVAGAETEKTCESMIPPWAWVVLFIIFLGALFVKNYLDYQEGKMGWIFNLVLALAAVGIWFLVDECRSSYWFLGATITSAVLVQIGALFMSDMKTTEEK